MSLSNCKKCWLHREAYIIGMETGYENPDAPLQIFIDAPSAQDDEFGKWGSSRVSRLLLWMLTKCSLGLEHAGINFTLHCCATALKNKKDKLNSIEQCSEYSEEVIKLAKSLLGLGELSCQRLTNQSLDRMVYQEHPNILEHSPIYIGYSSGYLLQKPGETVDVIRMIFWASRSAGLEPKVNMEVAEFDFGVI